MLGDLERNLLGDAGDRTLQTAVLERLHAPAAAADHVVMMVAARIDPLIARDAALDLESLDEPLRLEQLERPVDAGPANPRAAFTQVLLEIERCDRALVTGKGLDDSGAGAAPAVTGLIEQRHCMLGPVRVGNRRHQPIVAPAAARDPRRLRGLSSAARAVAASA